MVITDIKKNKNAEGYAVFGDGEFLFSLDGETVILRGLKKGDEITEEEAAELLYESYYHKAKEKALRLLERRAHSEAEIVRKLSENYPKEVSKAVAERLSEIGLINDLEFSRVFSRELFERKNFGVSRIKTELFKRGIKRDIIDEVLEEYSEASGVEKIVSLIERRKLDLTDEKVRRRAFARFMREGYSSDDIKCAFEANLNGQGFYD